MEDINKIIAKVYRDPGGYGSMKETLKDAKHFNKEINYDNVKDWFDKNVARKTQLRGYSSFIVPLS